MATLGYREVEITIDGNQVVCKPKRARLYWEKGPDKVRWVYPTIPSDLELRIEWDSPKKPCQSIRSRRSDTLPGGRALVTAGNLRNRGVFKYKVSAFDRQGRMVAWCDPDVDNRPTPPG